MKPINGRRHGSRGKAGGLLRFRRNGCSLAAREPVHVEGAPVIYDIRHALFDIQEADEQLERDLTSLRLKRITEYAMVRECADPTLRTVVWVAEQLNMRITDLLGDNGVLPPIH
jgi:hypothetical protein